MKFRWCANVRSDVRSRVAIVLLLSFGLGAAALLATALDRFLDNPLGIAHPETLVRAVYNRPPLMAWKWFSYSTYEAMSSMRSLEDIAIEGPIDATATSGGTTLPVTADEVSGRYFSLLGSKAELGRSLNSADESGNSGTLPVVLNHRFWMSAFAGSKSAIGSTLSLNGISFTVVGVMPKRFIGTQLDLIPDVWLPLSAEPLFSQLPLTDPHSPRAFSIVARLRSGVTIAQAQSEFSAIYRASEVQEGETDPRIRGLIQPAADGAFALHDQFGHAIRLLLWGIATLLLMMCASVSGLMLVKAARNQRGIAIRLALGASRVRLILAALAESLLLGLAGAAGGLLVAWLCAPLMMRLLPPELTQLPISLVPDLKIDALAVLLALGVSLIFGVFPALTASRIAPQQVLRAGTSTRRTGLIGRAILIFQTAASLVLLVGTGLLIHTFYVLAHTNPGFDVDHLIAFEVDSRQYGGSKHTVTDLPQELERSIGALPGVRDASLASFALMQRIGLKTTVAPSGRKVPLGAFLNTTEDSVSSTFFATLGIPILSGRSFSQAETNRYAEMTHSPSPAETVHAPLVPVVINQAFAHLIFPHDNPLGKSFGGFGTAVPGKIAKAAFVVVGVAGDSKYRSLREAMLPIFYGPYTPISGQPGQFYLYVRTQGPPSSIVNAARQVLSSLDPQLPFSKVYTMKEQLSQSLWRERLLSVLAIMFSVISILMAAMGLYALLSYDASQRTREFGIRSAVGAQTRHLIAPLLQELAWILLPGAAIGLAACFLLTRIAASLLYGIKPLDPLSFFGALLMVATLGLLSVWQPIRQAISVDPAIVLREE
jgi:predicted permease